MRPPRATPRGTEAPPRPTGPRALTETPHDPTSVPEGWEGIMVPGERILWRGRPIARVKWLRVGIMAAFGLAFAGFAVFWMVMAARSGAWFWAFGLIHFSVGLGLAVVSILEERMRLQDTFYTLSDRAAYVASRTLLKGRRLDTYPITAGLELGLRGGDKAGDVVFGTRSSWTISGLRAVEVGFLDITGAPEVFAILRNAREALR
ncbi:aspartate carbamoyltransferase catalytic subunit [Rhodobacter capsulatus]|uniref:aspartate carbamoyltransferase catalytic subunit n=1 Tax=Rhodobacter capsulatus TaxID=1061 RepID=UPI004028009E